MSDIPPPSPDWPPFPPPSPPPISSAPSLTPYEWEPEYPWPRVHKVQAFVTRPPSPLPPDDIAMANTGGSGWPPEDSRNRGPIHDLHGGWPGDAVEHMITCIMNCTFDTSRDFLNDVVYRLVPQLDARWHTPDKPLAKAVGYNDRGDIGPEEVHEALDLVLATRNFGQWDALCKKLLHNWIDSVWFRHSRAPRRVAVVIRKLGLFTEEEVYVLDRAVRTNALIDFRLVMHCLDPRDQPVYGRTSDGPGKSRLFRRFPDVLNRPWGTEAVTWDEDDGGLSSEASDAEVPYAPLGLLEQFESKMRRSERRLREYVPHVLRAEQLADHWEARLRAEIAREAESRSLLSIILRGLHAEDRSQDVPPVPSPSPAPAARSPPPSP